MKITKNAVVTMDFTLKDEEGQILDTSEGNEPLSYIHGIGSVIPGLEKALEEKAVGDNISVVIPPDEGYGQFNEELIFSVPKTEFPNPDELKEGLQLHAETEQGIQIFQVLEVTDQSVTLDGNHPLAGETLHFDVTVVSIREATEEELSHGHVH